MTNLLVVAILVAILMVLEYLLIQRIPPTPVTTAGEKIRIPGSERMSSDGKLAFLSTITDKVTLKSPSVLYIIDDGNTTLIRGIISPFSWSPDGSWGVATQADGQLVVIRIISGQVEILPLGIKGLCPEVGPRGDIAFLDQGRVKLLDPLGKVQVVDAPLGQCEELEWLPDGRLQFKYWMPAEKPKEYVVSIGQK